MPRKSQQRTMGAYFFSGPVQKDSKEYRPRENLRYALKQGRHIDGLAVHYLHEQLEAPLKENLIGTVSSRLQHHRHELAAIAIGATKKRGCVLLITEPLYPDTALRAINTIVAEFCFRFLRLHGSRLEDIFIGFQLDNDQNIKGKQERVIAALEKQGCLLWNEKVELPKLTVEGISFESSFYEPLTYMLVDKEATLRTDQQFLVLEAMNQRAFATREHSAAIEELDGKLPMPALRAKAWSVLKSKPVKTSVNWIASNALGLFNRDRD